MLAAARTGKNAVVIGGGLLGLEAANGLMKQGMQVTVVHVLDTLMERQLDPVAADMLRANLEERGLRFLMGAQTAALLGEERGAVRFKDGLEIPTDLVVMAVGIRPNFELAKTDRNLLRARYRRQRHHADLRSEGVCGRRVRAASRPVLRFWSRRCGSRPRSAPTIWRVTASAAIRGSVTSTKLKVTGIDLFSAGSFNGGPGCEEIVLRDQARGVYKKLVVKRKPRAGRGAVRRYRRWFLVFPVAARRRRHRRFPRNRAIRSRPAWPIRPGRLQRDDDGRRRRDLRLQRRARARSPRRSPKETVYPRRSARTHQGIGFRGSCTGLVEQLLAATVGTIGKTPPKNRCASAPSIRTIWCAPRSANNI